MWEGSGISRTIEKNSFLICRIKKGFEASFAEAVSNGIVAQPFREKLDYLYYWREQVKRSEYVGKTVCPRCETDYLVEANIKPLDELIWLCPECDALWPVNTQLSVNNFADYTTYMESKGQRGVWDFLDIRE